MPANTVIDKLFVVIAINNVGIKAKEICQFIDTIFPSVFSRLEMTNALKIQTGI